MRQTRILRNGLSPAPVLLDKPRDTQAAVKAAGPALPFPFWTTSTFSGVGHTRRTWKGLLPVVANSHSSRIIYPGGLSECFPKTYSYSSLT
jgi:hypothetical protein